MIEAVKFYFNMSGIASLINTILFHKKSYFRAKLLLSSFDTFAHTTIQDLMIFQELNCIIKYSLPFCRNDKVESSRRPFGKYGWTPANQASSASRYYYQLPLYLSIIPRGLYYNIQTAHVDSARSKRQTWYSVDSPTRISLRYHVGRKETPRRGARRMLDANERAFRTSRHTVGSLPVYWYTVQNTMHISLSPWSIVSVGRPPPLYGSAHGKWQRPLARNHLVTRRPLSPPPILYQPAMLFYANL